MNYTALQADVASYLHRSDGTETDFIERARVRIMRDLRVLELEQTATLSSFVAGVASLPSTFLELRKAESDGTPLRQVPLSEIDNWASTGTPLVFSIYGRNFHCPGASSVDIVYFSAEAVLSSGATEHPTMLAHPQIWLLASLAEGQLWAQDTEEYMKLMQAYDMEVARANRRADIARHGAAPAIVSDYVQGWSEALN